MIFMSSGNYNTVGKNYVVGLTGGPARTATTGLVYYINATIPLSVLHDLFRKHHVVRNPYMKIRVNLHANYTCTVNLPIGGLTYGGYTSVGNAQCCPFMLSPLSSIANDNSPNGN